MMTTSAATTRNSLAPQKATVGPRRAPCRAWSGDVAAAALPEWRAQFGLQHLAGGRQRQGRLEVDAARALVVGDQRAAVVDHRPVSQLSAWPRHHDGVHPLAPAIVRNADHRA